MLKSFFKKSWKLIPFISIAILISCKSQMSKVNKGNEIDVELMNDMHNNGLEVYKELIRGEVTYMYAVAIPPLQVQLNNFERSINGVSLTSKGDVETIEDFLVDNLGKERIQRIESTLKGSKFIFNFSPFSHQTYIYLFSIPDVSGTNKSLVSLVYNKDKAKWKLTGFDLGSLTLEGLTAPELYEKALNFEKDQNLIASYAYAKVALALATPAGSHFHYLIEPKIKQLFSVIDLNFNSHYLFPLSVHTKALISIARLDFTSHCGKITPLVVLNANHSATKEDAMKDVNDIHRNLNATFKGIDTVGDSIAYQVVTNYGVLLEEYKSNK